MIFAFLYLYTYSALINMGSSAVTSFLPTLLDGMVPATHATVSSPPTTHITKGSTVPSFHPQDRAGAQGPQGLGPRHQQWGLKASGPEAHHRA